MDEYIVNVADFFMDFDKTKKINIELIGIDLKFSF